MPKMDRGLNLPKNCSVYSHYTPYPTTILDKKKPQGTAAWHVEDLGNGARFYGSNTRIRTANVVDAVHDLRKETGIIAGDNKNIRILTGGHGDRFGHNWMSRDSSQEKASRIDKFSHRDFYDSDSKKFGKTKLSVNSNNMIKVYDIGGVSNDELGQHLSSKDHVILAHCYSRNDAIVRNALQLPPVPSYIQKFKPPLLPPLSERLRQITDQKSK